MMLADITTFDILTALHNGSFTSERNYKYPINEYVETNDGKLLYCLEIAATGADREDISVQKQGQTIMCSYPGHNVPDERRKYFNKGLVRRSFDYSWKFSDKLDLDKLDISYKNGLLTLQIPYKDAEQPIKLQIN